MVRSVTLPILSYARSTLEMGRMGGLVAMVLDVICCTPCFAMTLLEIENVTNQIVNCTILDGQKEVQIVNLGEDNQTIVRMVITDRAINIRFTTLITGVLIVLKGTNLDGITN